MARFKILENGNATVPCKILNESAGKYIVKFEDGNIERVSKSLVSDLDKIDPVYISYFIPWNSFENLKIAKEHGFKEYNPTRFDNDSVILRFQKRYDDDFGKKYFIDILKWDNSYVPANRRDKWWKPYSYTYETQITMFKDCKALNFEFFSDWTLEQVEKFMEDLFEKMKVNYYESWNDESGYRPKEDYRND